MHPFYAISHDLYLVVCIIIWVVINDFLGHATTSFITNHFHLLYTHKLLVTYATDAVKLGVKGAFITDGRVPHALLNELLAGGDDGMGSGGGGTVVTL